jgi:hypothetical protein
MLFFSCGVECDPRDKPVVDAGAIAPADGHSIFEMGDPGHKFEIKDI